MSEISKNSAVEMRDVSLAYEASIPVLRDINLSISEGEFVSIVGPSGCGKSTLLKLISGMIAPNGGEVRARRKSGGDAALHRFHVSTRRAASLGQRHR